MAQICLLSNDGKVLRQLDGVRKVDTLTSTCDATYIEYEDGGYLRFIETSLPFVIMGEVSDIKVKEVENG